MKEQIRVASAVARDPRLFRIKLAFFGFNMTEYATWVAILLFAYNRGGVGDGAPCHVPMRGADDDRSHACRVSGWMRE